MIILKNLIYILQKENYNISRFLRFVYNYRNWQWWNLAKRDSIKWTAKAQILAILSLVFWVSSLIFIFNVYISWYQYFVVILIFIAILPLFISFSVIFISPVDYFAKQQKIRKASKILSTTSHLTTIGITGSFGKTTMKEILKVILGKKFTVIVPPGNINTQIGIADFIIKNQQQLKKADFFIVEMGAYKQGEIRKIAKLVHPQFSFLTGIGTSHLERFGSLEKIIQTKFELAQETKREIFLNGEDKNIKENYKRFNLKNFELIDLNLVKSIIPKSNFGGLIVKTKEYTIETKLLAKHNVVLLLMAIRLARKLGLTIDDIKEGIKNIKPIPHRLKPIFNSHSNIWVIDDSYNGNFSGFLSGLEVLERHKGRKIVITPGIMEQGKNGAEIHRKLGHHYAQKVDLVLLINNSMVKFILEGFRDKDFKKYKIYNNAQEAHRDLSNILRPGDAILFQNDIDDNYY